MSEIKDKIRYYEGYCYKVVINDPNGEDKEFYFTLPINERNDLWRFIEERMEDYYEKDETYSIVMVEEINRYKINFVLC